MSLVATLLLNKAIRLPHGSARRIGMPEQDEIGPAAKGRRTRAQILALADLYPELMAKIAASELGITQVCALAHLHKLAEASALKKTTIKRLVFFTKPTYQKEAA